MQCGYLEVPRVIPIAAVLMLASAGEAPADPLPCRSVPPVLEATSLSDLSDLWFGSTDYRFAIMLATNSRTSDTRFAFIPDPNRLLTGTAGAQNHVCVPQLEEAERLRGRYDSYLRAVHDMALAEPSEVVDTLQAAPAKGPVRVVSWVREDQLPGFSGVPGQPMTTKKPLWVTLAPHLQEFCRDFATRHSADPDAVTLRLEQRLGLPPSSSKTHFVELEITDAGDGASLFRPCADPDVTTTSCAIGGPQSCAVGNSLCTERRSFFFEQYYYSYGTERPVEVPWTSLGYTFDWAPAEVGLGGRIDFVEVGESEYVVPAGVDARLIAFHPTMQYCAQ